MTPFFRQTCRSLIVSTVFVASHLMSPVRAWSFDQTIPATCPIPRSTDIAAITITASHAEYGQYGRADTWYPSWAADGNCYSPFMDGTVDGMTACGYNGHPALGFACIVGDDPLKLVVAKSTLIHETIDPAAGFTARYGCTVLSYKNTFYYGSSYRYMSGQDWHYLRPFAGFNISTDHGKTWTKRSGALFPEGEYPNIKIGEPHFVDFGREMEHSPDGKAYLVAFGAKSELAATRPQQPPMKKVDALENPHWCWGDCIYLLRLTPSPETINDPSKYEFYAGNGADGKPAWTRDFSKIRPVVEWPDNMGQVAVTYIPALKKFVMCVTDGHSYNKSYNSYFLESNDLTGPWRIMTYWKAFGEQAYFVNIPSKFVGATVENGAVTAWIAYSANFCSGMKSDPPGSGYAMCLRQILIHAMPSTKGP